MVNISIQNKHAGWVVLVLIGFLIIFSYFYPVFLPNPSPKLQPKIYSYYKIVDIVTGKTLMYVSSAPVLKGDELITEDNRHYVVVKVVRNKAYARYVKQVKLNNGDRK